MSKPLLFSFCLSSCSFDNAIITLTLYKHNIVIIYKML
nr:MAG TPA: hypothetical protein [Caudoviricetes sp.]DAO07840.1 MAG TPA: hypothetical protein [Caudoviricetes sp.]